MKTTFAAHTKPAPLVVLPVEGQHVRVWVKAQVHNHVVKTLAFTGRVAQVKTGRAEQPGVLLADRQNFWFIPADEIGSIELLG